jgi:Ca-activated chloride channel family protein
MWIDSLQAFHFIRPLWLWLLLPFAVLVFLNWRSKKKEQDWMKVIPKHLVPVLSVGEKGWSKQLPLKLTLFAGLATIVVIAGPTWKKEASPFGEDATNMVIILDVSESMLQSDVTPTRLLRAKQKIEDILNARDAGKTGLIVYSGSAHIAMPLTKDKKVFTPLLESISGKIMPREGKFAEYTVPLIDSMLKGDPTPSTILLITDGVNERTQASFDEYFDSSAHQLLILGMGNSQNQSDIPYEEKTLQDLANAVGGDLMTTTIDADDVTWIVNKTNNNLLISEDNTMPWADGGYPLTFIVAALYLLWFRKGFLVKWSVILALSSYTMYSEPVQAADWTFKDLWLTPDQQGQLLFDKAQYKEAAVTFESNQWKATSYYLAGEYKLAQSYYLREDSTIAKFGVANSLARQREYVAARAMFDEIVELQPEFPGAKENRDLMQRIIDQINDFSESQDNNLEKQSSRELGDKPQTSDGTETEIDQSQLIEETLSAEEILADAKVSEKWMKRVESKLDNFLSSKFYYQLEDGKATVEYENND